MNVAGKDKETFSVRVIVPPSAGDGESGNDTHIEVAKQFIA